MFCWGNATHHELYIENSDSMGMVIRPTLSKWKESKHIKCVAAGDFHTLYLTKFGHLYSRGCNELGQLGRQIENNKDKPPDIEIILKSSTISAIACGSQHSMALDEWGQVFSWGSDNFGQLGSNLGVYTQDQPKIIKFLATKNVIQIACGFYHSIALTNNGELYAWGANTYGQCGLGTKSNKETTPQQISSLVGIPIAMIACGGNHTFALSKSGAVFGWGKNMYGQLGLQDRENRCYPTHLKTLRYVKVCHISCGEEFTTFLTLDGGVFSCGTGEYGQTGHGTTKDELVPKKVMELMGSTVTQVACGRRHVLCRVGERVLACGHGARGQLGCPHAAVALVPTPVPFAPHDDEPPRKKSKVESSTPFRKHPGAGPSKPNFTKDGFSGPVKVFAGGDHSFLTVSSDRNETVDFRIPDPTKQILTLNFAKLTACNIVKDNDVVSQDLMAYLETVFGSLACMNASFLADDNAHFGCNTKVPGVNLKKAEEAFTLISRFENKTIQELIFSYLTEYIIKKVKVSPPDAEALRVFLILPLYHEMRNPRRHPELQGPFAEAYNKLSSPPQRIVQLWWEAQTPEYFEMLVDIFKSVFVYEMMQPGVRANKKITFTRSIVQILNTLTTLNKINFTNPKKPKIPAECFYIEDLSSHVDIASDYINWLSDQDLTHPHLCNYAFLFDVQCKSLLLKIDQQLQMQMAVNRAATEIFTRLIIDPSYEYHRDQFLILTVSRNHIVRDTMLQISNHDTSQLKKPLRVEFVGEEAEDAGGVKKEFFMLLLKEIFDPVYGMFKQSEETNMIWFSNNPFEEEVMYYLIGAIYGLAIYNSIIIYVPFPLVLYKKILGESVMLDDLSDLYPTLAHSLKHLLDYAEDDVEEVFSLCFAVNTEVFDQIQVHPLKENGENLPVTHENKSEYVDLYVDFLLNKSVEKQFKAFNQGFQKVCGGRIIKLFRSHELMSVVIGNEEYNWELFESNCEYENGYSSTDQQIRWFWEVFHELSIEDKKKFLLFLTGSDRVPIQGMRDIKIKIQPVADDRFFPVAHTCFNLLDLPRYKTKERLKYHLVQAIQQTQGFSLV
ncbi:probable E3 ubiquitin-protein ligase HERC4 isoform X1 [Vanessa atalanta]|uniref:probable E3 ubiquitin-protein ligase HERC4 isoform X1 n=1 Tax=Vanessa atalanta TaxID=42275 RepID=UPI001FCCF194|nr:probable E3 ubiquitin-protein ligase HERC4 isoform X1 [Vanessa atalanta]XP_047528624.1 probable E3 ubiquitin-protein ligase HERC4 isoform X1 [Vanessa atalanta]XP_047528625.1 probable E3 ubiquitin-protein ligase HERC4 isoform X1 [Vanessa atalanta]XP_047528626.1 probable E3 ubiquitin-protein ligase HERC4 isoform X1 [Vanessa atalanta]